MRLLIALLAAILMSLTGGLAMAQEREIAALKAVLAEGPTDIGLFAPSFLAALPAAQLEPVLESIRETIGPVTAVTHSGGASYLVESGTHEMSTDIVLDGEGLIVGLLFKAAVATNATLQDLLGAFEAVAPRSAFVVIHNGGILAEKDADTALAAGSAFKLGVLKALDDQIAAGTRSWDEVVTLTAADISLPSGITQSWPAGAPVTLHTLATLMISMSDNTATDVLMRVAGRDAVEAALGIAPALTTREFFVLKASEDLKQRYRAGDLDAKRAILDEVAALPLPDPSALTPHDEGIEWYLSPNTLCALIEAVGGLDVTQVNPGVANPADWGSVAFKGGSEIGVINLTTLATTKDGQRFCVAASWSDDKPVDEAKATTAYASLLARLARN